VLVTGASGFIGSAVCDALLARGDEVVALTRDPEKARRRSPRVAWNAWEPTLERPPAEAFEGVDGVVNLLGEKINQRWTDDAKRRIMESRRTGTHNLVGAIAGLERKPAVLVSQSAIGYYGGQIAKNVDLKPKVPTQLHFGDQDQSIPMSDVELIKQKRPDCEIHVYQGAGHGFSCDERGSYNEAAHKVAWDRTVAWLGKNVG